jgi:hypothetical protein
MFTVRNTVLVALMQVGVIVAGVLAAGVSHKWWTTFGARVLPPVTIWLMNYGVITLILPLVWSILVLRLRQRPGVSEDVKNLAFFSGILLLIALCGLIGYAVLEPWFAAGRALPKTPADD